MTTSRRPAGSIRIGLQAQGNGAAVRLAAQALEAAAQQVDQDHAVDALGFGPVGFADAMADKPGIGAFRGLRVRQWGRFECTLGFHSGVFRVVD